MKRSFKRLVKKIPIDFTMDQKYVTLTKKIMKIVLERDSAFVDIGCHKGQVLSVAVTIAPDGVHFGFEPIPDLCNKLVKKFGAKCDIRQVGLSNKRGVSKFNYVKTNPSYSGIEVRAYPGKESIEEIEIDVDTLDNQLFEAERIDLIKIDVEGAELDVLKGGVKTITTFNPVIVFEHVYGASDSYGATPQEMWSFFNSVNYNIYTLKNFIEKPKAVSLKEFEELYRTNKEYYFVARFRSS